MPVDDRLKRLLDRRSGELTLDFPTQGDVENRAVWIERLNEPAPLLRRRARELQFRRWHALVILTRHRRLAKLSCWAPARPAPETLQGRHTCVGREQGSVRLLVRDDRQFGDRWMPHEIGGVKIEARLPHPRRDAEEVDGIRSKRKQIVVNADFAGPQHVRPKSGELDFNRGSRRHDQPLPRAVD